ncbi:hypothetical protein RTG_00016 [Rhodotorula toruloides ATCC 204091]|uniref:Uncharacterized protein n=1 Tax=Rhodotorula toruloides TaxID=5286 RepID=A0A0K3C9E1_RHOTO|nr:hypothetical protein RTG_00016 [Rhodotorula toruloides ATCC 204091]KAK4335043.1 hypothetical protein RTBOTA2_003791 [Rhodotorula toruloides]PRQ76475.1 hypothetical protein AAT19DRAFT_13497 [Rhodotorula toruloides]
MTGCDRVTGPWPGRPGPPASSYALWPKQDSTHTSWQDVFLAMQLAGLQAGMVDVEVGWSDGAAGILLVYRAPLAGEVHPATTLCRAKPVDPKERDGPWRVYAWHKSTDTTADPILLFRYINLVGLENRCTVEAALRIESRRQGRFLRSATTTVHCNSRDRTLAIYTCTQPSCSYRVHLESSVSPNEWCCTVLRPFHNRAATSGEISLDLQSCLDYFPPVKFDLPLSPPPTPTPARSSSSHTNEFSRSPSIHPPKQEDQSDMLVLDDSEHSDQDDLDSDCVVAGDPFRSPTPENDYQMHDLFERTPRSPLKPRKANPARPSQVSSAVASPGQESTISEAPLEDEISALKAQLAALEQRLEAKTKSEQAAAQSSTVKTARMKARSRKGKLKASEWYRGRGKRGLKKRPQQ